MLIERPLLCKILFKQRTIAGRSFIPDSVIPATLRGPLSMVRAHTTSSAEDTCRMKSVICERLERTKAYICTSSTNVAFSRIMEDKNASNNNAAAENASAGASPAKKAAKSKAKAQRPKSTHPSTADMVKTAIKELKDRKGSSVQAIKKYIASTYKVDGEKFAPFIKRYLKAAVTSGAVVQTKGKGASGSFKLPTNKPTRPKSTKSTKRVVKKPESPKKTAEKKTVKKAPAPKKTEAKKAPEKKPAPKKAAAKTAAAKKVEAAAKQKAVAQTKNLSKTKKATKAPAAKTKTPKPKSTKTAAAKTAKAKK